MVVVCWCSDDGTKRDGCHDDAESSAFVLVEIPTSVVRWMPLLLVAAAAAAAAVTAAAGQQSRSQ